MSSWHEMGPFTVFDLETTGMSPVRDRIVEIGAVRVETNGTLSYFETLVNPAIPIPLQVSRVHGIDNGMVADAPRFKDAAYAFLDFRILQYACSYFYSAGISNKLANKD